MNSLYIMISPDVRTPYQVFSYICKQGALDTGMCGCRNG